jgi:hypothetical protein
MYYRKNGEIIREPFNFMMSSANSNSKNGMPMWLIILLSLVGISILVCIILFIMKKSTNKQRFGYKFY